jgi:hypothetical protein
MEWFSLFQGFPRYDMGELKITTAIWRSAILAQQVQTERTLICGDVKLFVSAG